MEAIRLPEPNYIEQPINIANLVTHNDPFNPNDKTLVVIPSGVLISQVLTDFEYDTEFYSLVVSKNQEILDTDFIIDEGDVISFVLVPKGGGSGKQMLMIVAMIGLAIATAGVSSAYSGALVAASGGLITSTVTASAIITATMMAAGSMLISSLFKPNVPSAPSLEGFDQSTTYGWNTQGNSLAQGGAIPVLYGTHRVTPQYIGKYLHTQNDTQVLKCLLAIGEGPLDSISFIQVNDLDVANFNDVVYDTRLGSNTQDVLQDFTDTWSDQGINKKLTNTTTWQYATTSGDAVTSLSIGISCPQGIYYANDQGGLSNYTVYIDIEYKSHASSTWLSYVAAGELVDTIYYYVDQNPIEYSGLLVPQADYTGPYDVYKKQIPWKGAPNTIIEFVETITELPATATGRTLYPPDSGFYDLNRQIAWTETKKDGGISYFSITGAQTSAIRRAYTASGLPPDMYDVRVRFYQDPATDTRHSSSVYFEFLQEAIPNDLTYPNTALIGLSIKATDQLSGGLPKVTCLATRTTGAYGSLDNPAWACLDLLTNTRYGAGVSISDIDMVSFTTWADFCTINNYKVNIYLDQSLDLSQSLQLIGQLGRGTVMQYGSSFRAIVDMPNILPAQGFLFSMGNILQNSFSETFLPLKERANIIEVTYYNEDNDYAREVIEVTQGNYDLVSQANKTAINLIGCTSKEQALKQARYHLNQNRYLTITASWEVSIDSIHCQVGDVINVAHDVPQWGYSGRIVSNTSSTITVDRSDLVLEPGVSYYIQVSDANTDEQVYAQVTNIVGVVLTVSTPLGDLGAYSVYAFGEVTKHAKKMRILSISTAGGLNRKITAIEYNENVFNDSVIVPSPVVTSASATSRLVASEYLKQYLDGSIEPVVELSWSGSRLSYQVMHKRSSENTYTVAGTVQGTSFEIYGLQEGVSYDFLVDGYKTTYVVQGKMTPPVAVTNLTSYESNSTYYINWEYPYRPLDFSHFEISKFGQVIGTTIATAYTHFDSTNTTKVFTVSAVDSSGNKSDLLSTSVGTTPLGQPINLKAYYIDGVTKLSWDKLVDQRAPIDYEIRMGTVWDNGNVLGRTIVPEYLIAANGDYMIKSHYTYPDGGDLYSTDSSNILVAGAVLPKNVVASFDEKATGWLGNKVNMSVSVGGDLSLDTDPMTGFVYTQGSYEIPSAHIIDIGTAQQCRLWVDYRVVGVVTNNTLDTVTVFDSWSSIDGFSDKFRVVVQVAIAQNDGVFGDWVDFVVGEYVGRKFKFRGLFYSLDNYTSCSLSEAKFYVDMPDKLQSANSTSIPAAVTPITYPVAFQTTPNLQITIINAVSGDTVQVTGESATGFSVAILNAGVMVARSINWLAKGY